MFTSTMLELSRSTMFVQTCRVLYHARQSFIWKGPRQVFWENATPEEVLEFKLLLNIGLL